MHTAKLYTQGGAQVSIETDGKRLVISPARKKYTLKELLSQCEGKAFTIDAEWENIPPVGREVI